MKSFTMKALAVAVLGLAGSSAYAVCPTIPATTATPGGGGAWSSQTVTSATVGNAPTGLNGTSCAFQVSINPGAAANTKGIVTDNSPQDEKTYRARFYVNTAGLTGLTAANRVFRVFNALATTFPATAGAGSDEVIVFIGGGATPFVRFFVGDTASPGSYKNIAAVFPNTAGNYRIEFALDSNAGTFRYWVSDAAAATTDAAPTGSATVTQTGWSGVKLVNLGIFGTSANYRTNVAGQALIVDEFDSRRQTFIGQ